MTTALEKTRLEKAHKQYRLVANGKMTGDELAAYTALSLEIDRAIQIERAAKDLCNTLIAHGYGKTSSRALPGEFDTLVAVLGPPQEPTP